jgi:hypothetical protein
MPTALHATAGIHRLARKAAGLTVIPAGIGARRPVAEVLRAE